MKELSTTDFDSVISQSELPMVVDFWAPWCGPCKVMAPILESIAPDNQQLFTVGKVNVDDHGDLAMRFNVLSIPTFIVFKGGSEIGRFAGAAPAAVFVEKVKGILRG